MDLYDYLKEEVGYRLADRVFDLNKEIKTAADIGKFINMLNAKSKLHRARFSIVFSGCNRGFVSRHILAETVQHLYLCESSPTMLKQAEGTPGLKVTKLEMDEECPQVFAANELNEQDCE